MFLRISLDVNMSLSKKAYPAYDGYHQKQHRHYCNCVWPTLSVNYEKSSGEELSSIPPFHLHTCKNIGKTDQFAAWTRNPNPGAVTPEHWSHISNLRRYFHEFSTDPDTNRKLPSMVAKMEDGNQGVYWKGCKPEDCDTRASEWHFFFWAIFSLDSNDSRH